MGWAVLHEAVTMRMLVAAGVILIGVALVNVNWSSARLLAYLPDRLRPTRAP